MSKEKPVTAQATGRTAPQVGKDIPPKKLIYIGPTITGLKTLTSFTSGLPTEAQTLISRDAKYGRLFVTVSGFIKAQKDVKEGGLHEIYKQAQKEKL